ncbi:MAG TPA: TIGR02206 family membrane protein [Chthoniobacteraceae bacterium]|jgi:hypothetical integral membrane protein (TIGR02206 family)|nr:TIGR02206 family membrane protein [Chthoniobacteraceae bacterium]
MPPEPPFHLFGPAHLTVIGFTVALPLFFWATARGPGREGYRVAVRYSLAFVLLANWIAYEVFLRWIGQFKPVDLLPMQLCDWATIAVIAALVTCRYGVYEIAYFWGMAGTLQAILTPNLPVGFPSVRFISFFVSHSGIVIGVMFLTLVERMRPRGWSVFRAMVWTEVYYVVATVVNGMTGLNFGFLNHPPAGKSLLDYLSSNHTLYILEFNLLAIVFYLVLYLPFWARDLVRKRLPAEAS